MKWALLNAQILNNDGTLMNRLEWLPRAMSDGVFVAPGLIIDRQSSFLAVVNLFSVTNFHDVLTERSEPISD